MVGLLGRGIGLSQDLYIHRTAQRRDAKTHPFLEQDSNSRSQCPTGRNL